MNEIVKVCKIHGELTIDKTRKDGNKFRCKQCRIDSNKKTYYAHREKRVATSIRWKQQNRGDYNEWCRQDRKKNPEKYRRYEQNYNKKHGTEKGVTQDICSYFKISLDEYEKMFLEHNNRCAICNEYETKKSRTQGKICRLAVDHCHKCEEKGIQGIRAIRGLLCHACNTSLGKFKDNINLLKAAITYLEKHNHVE